MRHCYLNTYIDCLIFRSWDPQLSPQILIILYGENIKNPIFCFYFFLFLFLFFFSFSAFKKDELSKLSLVTYSRPQYQNLTLVHGVPPVNLSSSLSALSSLWQLPFYPQLV